MTFRIRPTKQAKKITSGMRNHLGAHQNGLRLALHEVGSDVNRETKRLIRTGPKIGRIYFIKGRWHRASAPGEAPANLTGKLAKSNDYKVSGWSTMEVGETAPYAGYLEHGTRKMKPRPHLKKAVENQAVHTVNTLIEYTSDEINKL